MELSMKHVLETLGSGRDLSADEAAFAFRSLMEGDLTQAQTGAFLMGMRAKGETAVELAAGVAECLKKARLVPGLSGPRIDTCGTGGDNTSCFNCSTATALVLASMGHKVVKHGNRSVSSSCGSADVLESMGLPLDTGPEQVAGELAAKGFVFLFAPAYHPAFKHVVPVRRELGIRTLFNIMGPLLNPARPTHQLLGVATASIMPLVAKTLMLSGVERGAVVHGALGFDELTPFGTSQVLWIKGGTITEGEIDPAALGLAGGSPSDVAVAGKDAALAAMRELLAGEGPRVMHNMLVLNLAVALHLLEDLPLAEARDKAEAAVRGGKAAHDFGGSHA